MRRTLLLTLTLALLCAYGGGEPAHAQVPAVAGTRKVAAAGKARGVKAGGQGDDARKLYKDAVLALGEVMQRGGPMSYKAKELIAKYVREGELAVLSPDARMALIEALLREKKYDEAIPELRKNAYETNRKKVPAKVAFVAHRRLAVALRFSGDFLKSISEFEAILRNYRTEIGKTVTELEKKPEVKKNIIFLVLLYNQILKIRIMEILKELIEK